MSGEGEELRQAVVDAIYGTRCVYPSWAYPSGGQYPSDHSVADAVLAVPAIADALADAARLRSLAATFDSHLNRDKTYTGAQVAAMLRDGEG